MAQKEYSTSQVAAIAGIHPNTVRFYEEWGLITRPRRRDNGYRVFTQLQIQQIRLARTAFQTEITQNGLRKKLVDTLKTAAECDFDGALLLAGEYLTRLRGERENAEEAVRIARGILSDEEHSDKVLLRRRQAAEHLGVTADALRNWEMNGLLTVKRRANGYRVYTQEDIRQLRLIRALRCAGYSLESILRMLRQLSCDPGADIRQALNVPEQDEDIVSACDKLLVSLDAAENSALKMTAILQEMQRLF